MASVALPTARPAFLLRAGSTVFATVAAVIGAELSIRHPRRGGTVVKIQWQNPSADNEQPDGLLAAAGKGKA